MIQHDLDSDEASEAVSAQNEPSYELSLNKSKNITDSKNSDENNENDEYSDFKLPEVDWENLEAKLKQAQEEIAIQNKRVSVNNDRDEIRRKLALASSSSSSSSFADSNYFNNENLISDYLRSSSNRSKAHFLGQNLQICFMNDAAVCDEPGENDVSSPSSENGEKIFEGCELKSTSINSLSKLAANSAPATSIPLSLPLSVDYICTNNSWNTILAQLQYETKHLLANVPGQVRLKIDAEIEKSRQLSPIGDIVSLILRILIYFIFMQN